MALKALFYPDVKFETLYIPYIYREIYFEGVYNDVLGKNKDMVIIDVGANIGIVTDHMRKHAKKIYSLEPCAMHFEALKKNKEFNKWDNVEIFNMAVADKDGEMTLHTNTDNQTCQSLTLEYQNGESEKVKTVAFDTFFDDNKIGDVDFIKFDVEGAEDMILRSEGFKRIAHRVKAIEVEFHFPNWMELVQHMAELGFESRRYDSSAIIVLFTRRTK